MAKGFDKKANIFYQNRKRIKEICDKNNCGVSTGASIFAYEKGLKNYSRELTEFNRICRSYYTHPTKTIADMFKE